MPSEYPPLSWQVLDGARLSRPLCLPVDANKRHERLEHLVSGFFNLAYEPHILLGSCLGTLGGHTEITSLANDFVKLPRILVSNSVAGRAASTFTSACPRVCVQVLGAGMAYAVLGAVYGGLTRRCQRHPSPARTLPSPPSPSCT